MKCSGLGHKSEVPVRHSDGSVKWVVGDAIPEVREVVEGTSRACSSIPSGYRWHLKPWKLMMSSRQKSVEGGKDQNWLLGTMQSRADSKPAILLGLLTHRSLGKTFRCRHCSRYSGSPFLLQSRSRPGNLVGPNIGLQPWFCGTYKLSDWESFKPSPGTISGLCSATWQWWNFVLAQLCQPQVYGWWSTSLTPAVNKDLRSKTWSCNLMMW